MPDTSIQWAELGVWIVTAYLYLDIAVRFAGSKTRAAFILLAACSVFGGVTIFVPALSAGGSPWHLTIPVLLLLSAAAYSLAVRSVIRGRRDQGR